MLDPPEPILEILGESDPLSCVFLSSLRQIFFLFWHMYVWCFEFNFASQLDLCLWELAENGASVWGELILLLLGTWEYHELHFHVSHFHETSFS